MGYFGLLILAGALVMLWRRVDALQRELADLRGEQRARPAEREAVADATPPLPAADNAAATQALDEPAPAPARSIDQEPTVMSDPELPQRALPRFDFEDVFGRQLPIWAGGVTLAVAGFFLVRWAIDAGLLTPVVRVALAGLFGIALLAGAEIAYRWRERVADPRVAQALAGAGLATLYAAFYLAGTAYGLIGSTIAFMGLAAVTGTAIALSYRFGLPSAVLGLVGGFAAPALVGSEDANVPLLTLYLALVTAGLIYTGRRLRQSWLGAAALAGGLGWGALLQTTVTPGRDSILLGAYLVLLGAILPAFTGEHAPTNRPVRVTAAGIAALQIAILIQFAGFGGAEWSLYLLLGAALAWFGWREPAMREANAIAAAIGVALLLFWGSPPPFGVAVVASALAAIFAGVPLAQLWRGHGRAIDVAQAIGVAFGLAVAAIAQFGSVLPDEPAPVMGLALLALTSIPVAVIALTPREAWRAPWLLAAQGVAVLLAVGALAQVLPADALAWTAAAVAGVTAWRARALAGAVATAAFIAALWAVLPLDQWREAGSLAIVGNPQTADAYPGLRALGLYLLPSLAAGAAWWLVSPLGRARRVTEAAVVAIAVIAAHIAFRHAFAGLAGTDFVATGVWQRAVWEVLLLAAVWLVWQRGWRQVAIALVLAALAHFGWFSVVMHNPLWSEQAVGPLPLFNALLPAYGAGIAGLFMLRRWLAAERPHIRWAIDAAIMAAVSLLALSLLRQFNAGSLLGSTPMGEGEDLLRSLTGIVLAIGFLLWGVRTGERSWRIGSLVLMVLAVLKVFLVDADGLAGLARIVSFMALGFSLIGIGWFYSRQLRATPQTPAR